MRRPIMNRSWLFLILALALGCSSKPADQPTSEGVEPVGPASVDTKPTAEPSPAFEPSKTTPITTSTPDPQFPAQPDASPKLELSAEIKTAIANLVHTDAKVKDQAQAKVEALDDKTIDTLLAAAKDGSEDVRAGAMYGLLGRFNQFDQRMVTTVVEGLGDSSGRVRGFAVVAAGDMPPENLQPAIDKLSALLANSSEPPHVRAAAARMLAKLSNAAFAPLQKGLLEDQDRSVRMACLNGLIATAPSPADATFALSKVLDDQTDAPLRRAAANELAKLGEAATSAVPALIAALGDQDTRVAKAAAEALVRIGSPAVPLLAETAEAGDKPVRMLAIGALFQLGPVAAASQVQLEKATQDPDAEIRSAAAAALQAVQQ